MQNRFITSQALITLLLISALFIGVIWFFPDDIGRVDLVQYWSAGRAIQKGSNPYDPHILESIQRSVLDHPDIPILMWNPPIITPLLILFRIFSFESLVPIWFVCSIALVCFSIYLLRREVRPDPLLVILVATMPQLYSSLFYGQISPVLLLSLTLYLWMGRRFLGGLALSVSLIKPHLLYLIYISIALDALKERSLSTMLGFTLGFLSLVLVTLCVDLAVFSWYLSAWNSPPIYWKTPTLGSWIQELTGLNSTSVRVIPSMILGVTMFALLGLFFRKSKDDLIFILIPLSILTSPYGWLYDQLLLMPTIIWLFDRWTFESKLALYSSIS